jgi:ADP-ribosylglycohydrolase/DNA-binding CsgD family transcriptional regulator
MAAAFRELRDPLGWALAITTGVINLVLHVNPAEAVAVAVVVLLVKVGAGLAWPQPRTPLPQPQPGPPPRSSKLTARQMQVASFTPLGLSNKEIGRKLVPPVKERGVDKHMADIMLKLNVHSREQIAAWYIRHVADADRKKACLAGAVWGHLVGDALGVPYEFTPAGQIGEVTWGHKGTHAQPPGTWSDDGGLMLALLDSLLTAGFDLTDQAKRALRWLDSPDYKPGPVFDVGMTTRAALERIKAGTIAAAAGGREEDQNGNGSLMRILPVALVGRDLEPEQLIGQACRSSKVTHAHPRCQAVCAIYCLLVQLILSGETRREQVLAQALATASRHLPPSVKGELDTIRRYPQRSGSGYVVDAFWTSWDAFAAAGSYRDTVERAIRFGNDTDTTAAIAGGLAGAYWGLDAIPADWRRAMRGQEIATSLVDRLLRTA